MLRDLAKAVWASFPVLGRRTSPQWAAVFGFVLGGIGLGLYFRSFIDFIVPIAIAIIASLVTIKMVGADIQLGWLPGAIIASLYGTFRSTDSNRRIDEQARQSRVTPAQMTQP